MGWSAACVEQQQKNEKKKLKNKKIGGYEIMINTGAGAGAAENMAAPQLCLC